jgi:hypothetical protein
MSPSRRRGRWRRRSRGPGGHSRAGRRWMRVHVRSSSQAPAGGCSPTARRSRTSSSRRTARRRRTRSSRSATAPCLRPLGDARAAAPRRDEDPLPVTVPARARQVHPPGAARGGRCDRSVEQPAAQLVRGRPRPGRRQRGRAQALRAHTADRVAHGTHGPRVRLAQGRLPGRHRRGRHRPGAGGHRGVPAGLIATSSAHQPAVGTPGGPDRGGSADRTRRHRELRTRSYYFFSARVRRCSPVRRSTPRLSSLLRSTSQHRMRPSNTALR